MDLASTAIALVALVLALVALGAGASVVSWVNDRRYGRLRSIDLGDRGSAPLRSPRLRLVGRPDELRELPDRRLVPIEVKTRRAPSEEPPRSHRVQVEAYSLLLEEQEGRPPPYGVLRYGDGTEFRVRYDAEARREVGAMLEEMRRPYDGSARPSVARCRRCAYRRDCDRAAA